MVCVSVKRDLISVKRDLRSVKRDLRSVKRDLRSVKRDLIHSQKGPNTVWGTLTTSAQSFRHPTTPPDTLLGLFWLCIRSLLTLTTSAQSCRHPPTPPGRLPGWSVRHAPWQKISRVSSLVQGRNISRGSALVQWVQGLEYNNCATLVQWPCPSTITVHPWYNALAVVLCLCCSTMTVQHEYKDATSHKAVP